MSFLKTIFIQSVLELHAAMYELDTNKVDIFTKKKNLRKYYLLTYHYYNF